MKKKSKNELTWMKRIGKGKKTCQESQFKNLIQILLHAEVTKDMAE